jgi:hypothetical protein
VKDSVNVVPTKEDTEVMRILANVTDLPVGKSLILPALAHDGFGGVVVKRYSKKTYVFQREFSKERSRWADSLPDTIAEIRQYVRTGVLTPPDSVGW